MELLNLQLIQIPSFEPSVLTSFRSLINVVWTKEGQVTEILKRACSSSTGVMVHLGTFLFTAFDSGSKVLTICTSLKNKHTKHSKPDFLAFFQPGLLPTSLSTQAPRPTEGSEYWRKENKWLGLRLSMALSELSNLKCSAKPTLNMPWWLRFFLSPKSTFSSICYLTLVMFAVGRLGHWVTKADHPMLSIGCNENPRSSACCNVKP